MTNLEDASPNLALVMVTRRNLDWAVEFSGLSREVVIAALEKAEVDNVICNVQVKW